MVAGSHNLTGVVLVRVERTGSQTRYAGIVALMEQASMDKPRLARIADRIASPFLVAVVLAAAAAAAWWWPIDPGHALGVAVAVLIVTCPCALSLATPAATLAAAGALARRGVLVRRLQALEACASVDTVVFDKTGTLTEDRMALVATRARPGTDPAEALALAAALARHSLHPASRAIADAAGTAGVDRHACHRSAGPRACRAWWRGERRAARANCGWDRPLSAARRPAPRDAAGLEVHLADEPGLARQLRAGRSDAR